MTKNSNENYLNFLESLNLWWSDSNFRFKGVRTRNYYLKHLTNTDSRLIKAIIGARRVGKTSILLSYINYLLDNGVAPKNIILLNSDLREIQEMGIRETIELFRNKFNSQLQSSEVYILIDEIQELNNWQSELKLLYDVSKFNFVITGSSGLILAKKTSKLTGRYQLLRILPLSFKEHLEFNEIPIGRADGELEAYLLNGGYPEKIHKNLPGYLEDVVDSTIYRDMLEKFGIRQPRILKEILTLLADKVTNPVSIHKVATDLGIDDETAANYLAYLQSVYLIYPLYRNAGSNRASKNFPPKYYFNDTGILNSLGIRVRIGHLLENAVFLEFLRRQFTKEHYHLFYEVIDSQEYDFSDGENLLEVKYNDLVTDFTQYELKGKYSLFLPKPTILGDKSVRSTISEQGIDLETKDVVDFLLGN